MKYRVILTAGAVVLLVLLFLRFFSGALIDLKNPREALLGHLREDFRIELPGDLGVDAGVETATRDPGAYFRVRCSTQSGQGLINHLRAATKEIMEPDAGSRWSFGRVPQWWRPVALPGVRRLDVFTEDMRGGYIVYYSENYTNMLIFWFRT